MRALFPVGVMLVLLSGMEQTALASAKSEWKGDAFAVYEYVKESAGGAYDLH